ncbi:MAG TPA: ATP-binding protein [Chthoniobacterales bacterium]|nr:ATP-binding protein [Chthoniobacterales bacterium]
MSDLTSKRLRAVLIGVAAALLGALARAVLFRFVGTGIPFLTFFPAVIAAALWGGTLAGALTALVSLLLAPMWMAASSAAFNRVDWLSLVFFGATCALIVWAVRRAHWARLESAALSAKLAESEASFRYLADNIPQLAWMARPDGHIFWYNRRWFEYTGTTPEEMEGWGWQNVHDPSALPDVMETWKHALATCEPWEHTFPLRGRSGEYRWFLSRAMPLRDAAGNVTLWFGSNTDVTEQREHAEERRRLLESERAARSNAERASFLKDEFLATVSHELRTPLNAILGWAQLLRTGDDDAKTIKEGLETIERNARAQTRIIEDLLEMSRIISGKTRLDVQPTDLAAVIESAIDALRPAAEAKGVRIAKVLDPLQPISGDPARLQQVLWNLLANAIKFTPKGGRVNVVLERVNSHLEIAVSDNGEGISPDFLPYVFDRFRQQDASQTRRHGGLGLGLSIVKNLVELHGGSVRVESAGLGCGSTFTVALPLAPLRPIDASRTHPQGGDQDGCAVGIELDGVRVLVVDDERDSLELVRRLLEECKADVVLASSAAEGLRLVREKRPDVIVSDIGMPEKDGLEMMRELRARPAQSAKIPAIALTAFARSEDRTRAMLAGYQVHLSKPVEPQELLAAVANLAGRTGALAH